MDRDEAIRQNDHYRCRLCGQVSPITETICIKPGCKARLSLYGEMVIVGNAQDPVAGKNGGSKKKTPKTDPPVKETKPPKPEKPVREQKAKKETAAAAEKTPDQPPVTREKKQKKPSVTAEKKPEQPPVTVGETGIGKPFIRKKSLMICLDIFFFLVYSGIIYCVEVARWDWAADITGMLICICAGMIIMQLQVALAIKEKYILHGFVTVLNGIVTFVVSIMFLQLYGMAVLLVLVMTLAYFWLGFVSFIGTSKRRKKLEAEGRRYAFLKKKAVLLNLDLISLLVFAALFLFKTEFLMSMNYASSSRSGDETLFFLIGLVQLVLSLLGIILAGRGKYVLHGFVLLFYGGAGICSILLDVNLTAFLAIDVVLAGLSFWMGTISFSREKALPSPSEAALPES